MENYEKKYKEALSIAKDLHDNHSLGMPFVYQTCEDIFPELKESEDERIRNFLIKQANLVLDSMTDDDEEVPAWKSALAWLEKQGEQKPTDNAEPKFEVGDWIVYNRNDDSSEILHIYDIRDNRYYFNDNIHFSWSVKECDEKSHLWTIQDAKDGDVLICDNDERPFIFKGLLDYNHPNSPVVYCGIDVEDYFVANHENHWWTDDNVKPATKKHRDLLFQKMKEAGYEWDAEKKELKKIKQKPVEWSEEDEKILNKIQDHIREFYVDKKGYPYVAEPDSSEMMENNWLKSLKDRVQQQPKQQWSEENIVMINDAIHWIQEFQKSNRCKDENDMQNSVTCENWLKSIKPKTHWKPSEQNIKDLEWCAVLVKDKMGVGFHRLQVFIDELKNL